MPNNPQTNLGTNLGKGPKTKTQSEIISEKIQKILEARISPENIRAFYSDAADSLGKVLDEVIEVYKKNNPENILIGKDLEDKALETLFSDTDKSVAEINNVNNILDRIAKKQEELTNLETLTAENIVFSPEILVVPDRKPLNITGEGWEEFKDKTLIPRLLTLIYILEHDCDLGVGDMDEEGIKSVEIVEGNVDKSMMRTEPYFRVFLPSLNRVIYICDEEGNATFVFDTKELENMKITFPELDTMSKDDFDQLKKRNANVGIRIVYGKKWRENILAALQEKIEEKIREKKSKKSDFTEKEVVPNKADFPGWKSANSLSNETGGILESNTVTIKKFVEKWKAKNFDKSDWIKVLKPQKGPNTENYSPELVNIIVDHFGDPFSKQNFPHWKSASSLNYRFGGSVVVSIPTIQKFVEKWKTLNPDKKDCIKTLKSKTGRYKTEYYSPELIQIIKSYFDSISRVKDNNGWLSAFSLSSEEGGPVKANTLTIKKFVEKWKLENLDKLGWIKIMKNGSMIAEHYSPELVKILINHFSSVPKKEDNPGWESASSLSKEEGGKLDSNALTIKKFVEKWKTLNPDKKDYIKIMKNGPAVAEHYSQELVKIIVEHFEKINADREARKKAKACVTDTASGTDTNNDE